MAAVGDEESEQTYGTLSRSVAWLAVLVTVRAGVCPVTLTVALSGAEVELVNLPARERPGNFRRGLRLAR